MVTLLVFFTYHYNLYEAAPETFTSPVSLNECVCVYACVSKNQSLAVIVTFKNELFRSDFNLIQLLML